MNDAPIVKDTKYSLEWLRLEKPIEIFGGTLAASTWIFIIGLIVAIGLFYVIWMYVKDSRNAGLWAIVMAALRTSVYLLLAVVFFLPAWRKTELLEVPVEKKQSKVIILYDVTDSMGWRDELPPEGAHSLTDKLRPEEAHSLTDELRPEDA